MKKSLALWAVVLAVGLAAVTDAEAARRLGGGKSSGMHRENVTAPQRPANGAQSPQAAPGQQAPAQGAAPAAAGAPAAAAASNRSRWMAPLAGLAAGLGLAALASHLGLGAAFGNILLILLLALVAFAVIGMLMRKRAGQGAAMAGAGAPGGWQQPAPVQPAPVQRSGLDEAPRGGSLIGSRIGSSLGASSLPVQPTIPADFDAVGFAQNAKAQFMALQQANDTRDLARLREYLTPEMLQAVQADFAAEPAGTQHTEVYGLHAQVLQVEQDGPQYVVSVRFTGAIRHEAGAAPEDFDEVWHLTKPRQGSGGWVIAGIQQVQG